MRAWHDYSFDANASGLEKREERQKCLQLDSPLLSRLRMNTQLPRDKAPELAVRRQQTDGRNGNRTRDPLPVFTTELSRRMKRSCTDAHFAFV